MKEVTRALETLNPNKSIGHDKIPPRVLKLWCNVLAPSLTNIFNVCIQTSNWPEQWKRGIWVPLHKKDNHSDITVVTTNTRPQRVFSSVQTCVLVDVNQPLPWFFTRWPREDSFSVSWAPGRICRRTPCTLPLDLPLSLHCHNPHHHHTFVLPPPPPPHVYCFPTTTTTQHHLISIRGLRQPLDAARSRPT